MYFAVQQIFFMQDEPYIACVAQLIKCLEIPLILILSLWTNSGFSYINKSAYTGDKI